ncbi:uncharacterized protein zgc:113263 isoform X1 [Seriola aureovittata]|uniref:uncharacterized protein zgc:113263 isoform X1 n=1 Tax=Seriola aureovittata TaxID=2871759 RepID=UPI0024BE80D0|nr:uncharacterized protein zgc:113263 isoform X1 [Seriola aureovittata]
MRTSSPGKFDSVARCLMKPDSQSSMETIGGNDLPLRYLRLLAPPLQLLSAAVWQIVQQGLVDHYGMLEEFVTMVTELVPELMSYSQRAQLILGLRARLVLEMCRGEHPMDMQAIQPHLDRIKAPVSTAKDHHVTINQVEESEVNFVELVHSLLDDPSERKYFFQEIFPVYFGPKYDTALEMLVWEFISRLDELLPVPDFTQLAALLGDAPTFLDDCLQSLFPPEDMKAVLEHHRNLGHFEEKDPRLLPMDDCILSSLSLPPGAKVVKSTTSCSPALNDSTSPEHKGRLDAPINTSGSERAGRRSSETSRQRLKETKDSDGWQLQVRGGNVSQERKVQSSVSAQPCDETIDLTTPNETAETDSAANEDSQSLRGARVLRKRKLSGGEDVPAKQPVEASVFLDSSVDDNSGESPLISIWGEYTDSQEGSLPVVTDMKVPWSDEETLHLLDIWGKDSVQRALKGCLKNRHIFTQIAQKMAERGYMRTVEQCQTRIKRLKKCFRQNKGNSRLESKFYERLECVLRSSAPPAVPEVTYDVEEVLDEDEGDEDLQFLGHASRLEIGTRSVPWTDPETLALIDTWGEDKMQQELRGMHRNGHIFSIISTKMAAQGFSRTPEQCQTRLKRLKSNFRQCYQNNLKGQGQVECKFYNELGRILVKDFASVPQLDEILGEPEDGDIPTLSHQDIESVVGIQEDRKKVPWSDKETIILLEIWGDVQVQQSLRRYPHNGHIFTEISEKLSAHGYTRSADQCHTRIKRLKANYRQCQENMSSSGTDRVDFKFYDLLEQILEKQPSTSAAVVTDSIEISEDSNSESVTETDGDIEALSSEKAAPSTWSDEETLALIDIWGEEDVQRALRGFVHNGHVYADIAERMHDLGFSKTSEQCRWKVKSLRNNFRQCYDRKKCGRRVDYRFYNQLEQILGLEAVSLDEYDERDEQVDQEPAGVDGLNTVWTEHETVALVEVWAADDVQHSLKTSVRNGHIFADISEKMAALGYLRTAEQCHSRIKRLKKTYRRHSNSRRSGGRPTVFRYFHLLAPVLGDDSLFADVDSAAVDATLQSFMDKDADLYEQPSTSHLLADLSRKMPWSDLETRTLLEIWGEDNVQLTLRGCLKNRHVFEYISDKMGDRGFMRTSEQCYTRIKRLKHGFLHEKEEFKFFSEMEEIFRKELKVDGSVTDTSVPDEPDDCAPEPSQKKVASGNQWVADSTKLAWSDGETEALLDIWGSKEIQDNLKGCTKNKHIFIQISQVMASQGYLRTPEQCQTRIKRLRANFRHFLEGRKGEKQECKFFDQLVKIFGSKYVLNSDPLADDTADIVES